MTTSDLEESPSGTRAALQLVTDKGLEGLGPLSSSKDLAHKYASRQFPSEDKRIGTLTAREARKTFGVGFVTGIGGFITLPISLPASVVGATAFQTRLIGTIAELRGYDTSEPEVRMLTTLCLYGDTAGKVLKELGMKTARDAIERLSHRAINRILLDVVTRGAMRTSTNLGARALVRGWPAVGGVVGGSVDYGLTKAVGRYADQMFVHKDAALA